MLVPNRHKSSADYRYGFQGQEKDDELKGEGNSLNYTFRMHDPRVGRFFAVDPLAEKMPNISPYTFCGNNPISNIDPDGRYFFGLFGSSASERRTARAERFAAKVGGSVVSNGGRTTVNYAVSGSSEGGMSFKSKSGFGDFSSWKNTKETLVGFDRALEGSSDGANYGGTYGGVDGMRTFGEDASSASTYVKGAGVLVTASSLVVGPEAAPVGIGVFEVGDAMDKASTALLIGSDLNDGNLSNAGVRIGAEIIDAKVGKMIDASSLNSVQKFGGKAATDGILDKTKGELLEP
jgi:RHS repeat-associated protein